VSTGGFTGEGRREPTGQKTKKWVGVRAGGGRGVFSKGWVKRSKRRARKKKQEEGNTEKKTPLIKKPLGKRKCGAGLDMGEPGRRAGVEVFPRGEKKGSRRINTLGRAGDKLPSGDKKRHPIHLSCTRAGREKSGGQSFSYSTTGVLVLEGDRMEGASRASGNRNTLA